MRGQQNIEIALVISLKSIYRLIYSVTVHWRFFYPTTTRRVLPSLFNLLDEIGNLETRSVPAEA